MFRECIKCLQKKALISFYKRKSGIRAGKSYQWCIECYLKRGRDYYHKNRKRQLSLAKQRTRRYLNESLIFLAKAKNKPCSDCGKYFPPWVMDFDHVDRTTKYSNVSWLRRFHNLEKVKKEIRKCRLLCANCHRIRTLKRSGKNYYDIIQELKSRGYRFLWEPV